MKVYQRRPLIPQTIDYANLMSLHTYTHFSFTPPTFRHLPRGQLGEIERSKTPASLILTCEQPCRKGFVPSQVLSIAPWQPIPPRFVCFEQHWESEQQYLHHCFIYNQSVSFSKTRITASTSEPPPVDKHRVGDAGFLQCLVLGSPTKSDAQRGSC